ncbi:MAG: cobalt/nickel transport system ATP-binding protein [Clostridia bacterium]|jgi:cobalt/nickel transport system ATP-binding protein|nr:cobalt/nickel transport system ATP-binding protein [Clostridia bacterium]MDN5321947.1 cobalt/nickel transport system ATP-binding protein [Clostridia bacterium]
MFQYILEAKKIEFSYLDGTKAIKDLSLKIPQGKKIAVVGNNGAGKTTLFLHFNGVHRPQKGEILFKGEKLSYNKTQLKTLRKNIGIVFQDPDNQLFSASVYQDISFGPVNLGWPENKIRAKIEKVMKQTGTWDLRDKPTHSLSHGQKKRVAIAGILVMEPEIIILDEPTAGLDPIYTGQIMKLLDDFNKNGTTIVLSSHNIDEIYAWADYVFVINAGEIIAQGLPEEVFRNENILKKANLIKPWVLEIFDELMGNTEIAEYTKIPRTREEIINIIRNLHSTCN